MGKLWEEGMDGILNWDERHEDINYSNFKVATLIRMTKQNLYVRMNG